MRLSSELYIRTAAIRAAADVKGKRRHRKWMGVTAVVMALLLCVGVGTASVG